MKRKDKVLKKANKADLIAKATPEFSQEQQSEKMQQQQNNNMLPQTQPTTSKAQLHHTSTTTHQPQQPYLQENQNISTNNTASKINTVATTSTTSNTTKKSNSKKKKKELIQESDEEINTTESSSSVNESDSYSDDDGDENMDFTSSDASNRRIIKGKRISDKTYNPFIFPSANKLNNIDALNACVKTDRIATHTYKNNFTIQYNAEGTITNIEDMLNSEYLSNETKASINHIKEQLNKRIILNENEVSTMIEAEKQLQVIAEKQVILAVETGIYYDEPGLLNNEELKTAKLILDLFNETKNMSSDHMNILKSNNLVFCTRQKLHLIDKTLSEIRATNEMTQDDLDTAMLLQTTLHKNKCLNTTEMESLDRLLSKQTDIALIRYQKKVVDEALNIKPISKENSQELVRCKELLKNNDVVDLAIIKKFQYWIDRSKQDNELLPYFAEMKITLKQNEPYTELYPMDKYWVVLRGKGISNFPNSYEARCKEIKRFKNVTTIMRADLQRDTEPGEESLTQEDLLKKIKNNKNEKREIRIQVNSYKDVCTLMEAWPFDAFYKGVTPVLDGIESLPLLFTDVPKHFILRQNTSSMRRLEQEFGIVNVARQFHNDDPSQPKPLVKALPTTIKSYVDALTIGVDLCGATRIAKPDISYARLCIKCSSPEHYRCPDEADTYCKKCNVTSHTTDKCQKPKSEWRCRNCNKMHRSDSEECEVIRRITYKKNEYPTSILLGENIIRHISKILRNQNIDYEELSATNQITEIISNAIATHPIIQDVQTRLANEEKQTVFILKELTTLAETDAKIIASVEMVDSKVDTVKLELQNLKQDIEVSRKENMAAHANNSGKQDEMKNEMNTKLGQLLSIMSQLAVPSDPKSSKDKARRSGKEK